jgi:hypothetical protein
MTQNEIFMLIGICLALIILAIIIFSKGNTMFVLAAIAICVALVIIGVCLYLVNKMIKKLDTNSKSTGEDIGLLKKAIGYIAQDNNNASEYITQFLEAVSGSKETEETEEVQTDAQEEVQEENTTQSETKLIQENSRLYVEEEANHKVYIPDEIRKANGINAIQPKPKATLNLEQTLVSNKALTDALKNLVNNMNAQTQTVQQVQQIQNTTVETVVNAIQTNPTVQQAIFTTPAVQDTIAQNQQIIETIIQSNPIQQIIINGGNVDLTDIRTSISNLNTVAEVQGANIIEMDKFLKFVDQTSAYVDEEGTPATIYNGVDISQLQAILTGGSTINLQTIQNSINSLNNIVTSQTTDLTTIDNYLKFVDQSLAYVDEQGTPVSIYPGITH